LRKLGEIKDTPEVQPTNPHKDQGGRKDRVYTQAIQEVPELGERITQTLRSLSEHRIPMPITHVTSRTVRYEDGTEVSTGYIENIQANGFRPRDTNVGAFIERGNSVRIGSPEYFAANPHKFLRSIAEIISHYKHHGIRTNKPSLGEAKDQGVGLPTMLVIDTRGVQLLKGTDYDDHFRLHNQVPASNIVGAIDLDGKTSSNIDDVKIVANEVIESLNSHFLQENEHSA
jgi:hypothetical protein